MDDTFQERLARQIDNHYGLNHRGAALAILDTYITRTVGDPALYDDHTDRLTEDGEDYVTTEIADEQAAGPNGTPPAALLDAISNTAAEIRERTIQRDELIRAAMRTDVARARIAAAAELTEARLYQIRDGRR